MVNYVENHDNQTLFDLNAFKLPLAPRAPSARACRCSAAALNAFSQGITYFHAGVELLRSKSMDRNSFDSGDWFNRIDWTGDVNHFGTGLPPAPDNGDELAADAAAPGRCAATTVARRHRVDPERLRATCCGSVRVRPCSGCAPRLTSSLDCTS